MTSATIISDASFCPTSKCAGWGAWMIAGGRSSLLCSGGMKAEARSAAEAETLALANALHIAVREGYVERGSPVLFQSDSIWALAAVRRAVPSCEDRPHAQQGLAVAPHRKVRYSPIINQALQRIATTVVDLGLCIAVRHVRGHQAGDGRQWVNRACDQNAKAAMRAARRAKIPVPVAAAEQVSTENL